MTRDDQTPSAIGLQIPPFVHPPILNQKPHLTGASRIRAHAVARTRGRRLTIRLTKDAIVACAALALVGHCIARLAANTARSGILATGNEFDVHDRRHGCICGRRGERPRGLPRVAGVENGARTASHLVG